MRVNPIAKFGICFALLIYGVCGWGGGMDVDNYDMTNPASSSSGGSAPNSAQPASAASAVQAGATAMANGVVAMVMKQICTEDMSPAGKTACMIAVAVAAQVVTDMGSMLSAGKTKDAVSSGGAAGGGYDPGLPINPVSDGGALTPDQLAQLQQTNPQLAQAVTQAQGILTAMKAQGITPTATGVQANGQNVSNAALSDPASAAAAMGLSPVNAKKLADDYAKAIAAGKKAASEYSVAAVPTNASTGSLALSGGGAGGFAAGAGDGSEADRLARAAALRQGRNPAAAVAGMSRSLAGSLVGVSGDDIFQMISRRYSKKRSENAFYGN